LLARTKNTDPFPLIVHGHDDGTILSLGHPLSGEFKDEIIELIRTVIHSFLTNPIEGE
jgi:hypothetical protein